MIMGSDSFQNIQPIQLPVFALAVAGVVMSLDVLRGQRNHFVVSIAVGLMVGKPLYLAHPPLQYGFGSP